MGKKCKKYATIAIYFHLFNLEPELSDLVAAANRYEMKQLVRRREFVRRMLLLGSALLLLTTAQFLPAMRFQHSQDAQQWVEHTLQVLNVSEEVLSDIEDAETSERGYLLTGNESYLKPFEAALAHQSLAKLELRRLTVDNAAQQVRIAELDRLLVARSAELVQVVQIFKTAGTAAAAAAVARGPESRVMERIRLKTSEIQQEEHRLLKIRSQVVEAQGAYLRWTLRAGGFCIAVLLTIFGVVSERDILAHKRAEELMKRSEKQFHTLANAIPQLCWIANSDGEIIWYNQRWYDFTGTTFSDMAGLGWQSVHDPKALPAVLKGWEKSIELGEPFEMVYPLRATDKTFHPFLSRAMPLRDESGVVTRWFGTNTDVASQRRIEDSLRKSQESLRLAQEVAQIGTFEWDLQTGGKERTPELEAMYGLPPGGFDASQKTWLDSTHPDDREYASRRMEDGLKTGTFEAEWRVIWPSGEERAIFGRGRVLKDDAGKPLRMIGAIVDITVRKRAEQEILRINVELEQRVRRRTGELEAANKELAAFSYSVSHDLRAPLRGIDGWSLALLEDYGDKLDAGARDYLNRVRSETQRMGRLIDDMLHLSRVTRDEMELGQVDLTALAHSVTATLRQAQPERAIEFVITPALVVAGDKGLLEIALTNLLSNAVKFTSKRDRTLIEFGSDGKEGERAFYVRDNGAGFDMSYARNLFGAFQRFHKVSEFPGSGIGLAIVQRVVSRHGGRIWAESKVNSGATFWFTLGVHS